MPRRSIWRVLRLDAGLLVLATGAAALVEPDAGRSVAMGGLIFLLPHAWFAERVFRRQGARAAREVAQGFYRAEAGKFLVTAAGFAAAFASLGPGQAGLLLGAYGVLYVVNSVLLAALGRI